MTMEDQLRDAMTASTETVEPHPGGWERIQAGVAAERRRRRARVTGLGVLGAAAAAVLVIATLPLLDSNDEQAIEVGPAASTTTGPTPTTTTPPDTVTTSTVPAPTPDELFPGLWPVTSQAQVEAIASSDTWDDPLIVAQEFARDYLGMFLPTPVNADEPRGGQETTVAVKGPPNGPVTNVSLVRTFSAAGEPGPWVVTGATTANIVVTAPASGSAVASPVAVIGQASAFEGNVLVEVREDGRTTIGQHLGRAPVTGSGGAELGPFQGDIPFDPPSAPAGAVVFSTHSAESGLLLEAAVVRVRFGSQSATTEVTVFFEAQDTSCGEQVIPVARTVAATDGVLRASLEQLLAGPNAAERSRGVVSTFSVATAELLRDVGIDADGAAVVDFEDLSSVSNLSTSCSSAGLLAELDATVFQFPTVTSVEYRMEGSCDAFFEFLQMSCETRRP